MPVEMPGQFAPSWHMLAPSLPHLGFSLGDLGRILAPPWAYLEPGILNVVKMPRLGLILALLASSLPYLGFTLG